MAHNPAPALSFHLQLLLFYPVGLSPLITFSVQDISFNIRYNVPSIASLMSAGAILPPTESLVLAGITSFSLVIYIRLRKHFSLLPCLQREIQLF